MEPKLFFGKGARLVEPLKLLLIEDEPAALQILKNIVAKLPLSLEVLGCGRNGIEAQNLLETYPQTDVVITDIKMPLMDGLELAAFIHQKRLSVDVIILSGFQEFTFAQKALAYGVKEYLLKPLSPAKLTETLETISKRRQISGRAQERELLQNYLNGNQASSNANDQKQYKVLLIHLGSYNGLVVEFRELVIEQMRRLKKGILLQGQKKYEYFWLLENDSLAQAVTHLENVLAQFSYFVIYHNEFCKPKELNGLATKLSRWCELNHTLDGQWIRSFSDLNKEKILTKDPLDWQKIEVKLEAWFLQGNWRQLKKYIIENLVSKKALHQLTTLQILDRGNRLLSFFNGHLSENQRISTAAFSDVILGAVKLSDVVILFQQLQAHFFQVMNQYPEKINSEAFYQLVEGFVKEHFAAKELSLNLLSQHFGISTTSVNDLFKTYQKKTFKEVLVNYRMEHALVEIRKHPTKSLKQIAEEVGYQDALYFSKVFKKNYGSSPSAIQKESLAENNP